MEGGWKADDRGIAKRNNQTKHSAGARPAPAVDSKVTDVLGDAESRRCLRILLLASCRNSLNSFVLRSDTAR